MRQQAVEVDLGVVDQRDAGAHRFAEIMGRNVGRHADRDAGRAVDQQVGDAGWQDGGFLLVAVVVG